MILAVSGGRCLTVSFSAFSVAVVNFVISVWFFSFDVYSVGNVLFVVSFTVNL